MISRVTAIKETLADSTVHEIWEHTYRNSESERLYERVFDWIAANQPLQGRRALDIGCGIGQHAIRLAKVGCDVVAADFSPDRVISARQHIERQGFSSRIRVCNQDLVTGLSFDDGSYDVVLCWGVLMHIPELAPAIRELVRVTRPGGKILVCEANSLGVDAVITAASIIFKRMAGRIKSQAQSTEFGREYWIETPGGQLFTRHSRIGAVVRFFEGQGCRLRHRIATEFTEVYGLGGPIAHLAHIWNRVWFAAGHIPYFAHGNLLVFERNGLAPLRPREQ